jgi:L-threonylcarbamoyladenylate synthase
MTGTFPVDGRWTDNVVGPARLPAVDSTLVADAARLLAAGGLVAFPTETVYGLGADASSDEAVGRIFAVKGRPPEHPVIVHVAGAGDLAHWAARVPATARVLTEAFWPGPLTVIVPKAANVPDIVTGGLRTVGLRAPSHPVAQELLAAFGGGIAAPSANRFGRVSPTSAAAVKTELDGGVDMILDGGPCTVGVESTIVDCTGPEPIVLRVGGVTIEALAAVLGHTPVVSGDTGGAPGTLPSHYRPAAAVVLCPADELATVVAGLLDQGQTVGVLALEPPSVDGAVQLDAGADVDDFARVLYERFRDADAQGLDAVVAVPPPLDGMGRAVADRLLRAAAPAS